MNYKESQQIRKNRSKLYLETVSGIAEYFPEWEVEIKPVGFDRAHPQMTAPNGARVYFNLQGKGDNTMQGKIWVSGFYPQHNGFYHSDAKPENRVHIGVSLHRGAEVLAKEIKRRFLPDYLSLYDLCIKYVKDQETLDATQARTLNMLHKKFGGHIRRPWGSNQPDKIDINTKEARAEVTVNQSSINIDLKYMTTEQATRVLAALIEVE